VNKGILYFIRFFYAQKKLVIKMPNELDEIIIDFIIVLILLTAIYRGYKRGFIKEFMSFFGTFVSLVLAVRYMSDITNVLYGTVSLPHSAITVISFLIIFIPIMLLFRWISVKLKLLSKFSFSLGSIDRIAGTAFGLLKGAVFVSICTIVISLTGLSGLMSKQIDHSAFFVPMKRVLPIVYGVTKVIFLDKYKSFYVEMKESLSVHSKAVMDTKAEDFLSEFEGK